MKKKIISVLAVVAMLVFACGTAFSAEFSIDLKGIKDTIKKDVKNAKSGKSSEGTTGTAKAAAVNTEPNSEDDFDWKVNDDFTEITITKYKGERKDVIIPATIQDVPVTCIGESAFSHSKITSVVIPEGVKEIVKEAFKYCSELKSITLPAGICIGKNAFERCEAIETVILGENSTIGECAFEFCDSLQSIEIPKGCTLKKEAFCNCQKLESVTLPEGLKIIPNSCFRGCKSLANINFPSTLKYIGRHAFDDCPLAVALDLPEGLEFIGGGAFKSNAITSVSLPKSLKWVTNYSPYSGYYYYDIISGNNISTITIAEGCAPKAIGGKEGMDGRDLIKGASIDKSLKMQKQLAALKLPVIQKGCSYEVDDLKSNDSKYKKNGSIKADGYTSYLTDIGKSLYDDLLSYGFTEEEAANIVGN